MFGRFCGLDGVPVFACGQMWLFSGCAWLNSSQPQSGYIGWRSMKLLVLCLWEIQLWEPDPFLPVVLLSSFSAPKTAFAGSHHWLTSARASFGHLKKMFLFQAMLEKTQTQLLMTWSVLLQTSHGNIPPHHYKKLQLSSFCLNCYMYSMTTWKRERIPYHLSFSPHASRLHVRWSSFETHVVISPIT